MTIDARIPVIFGPPAANDVVLAEEGLSGPADATFRAEPVSHAVGCACCAGRSPAAAALAALFAARARGETKFFSRVAVWTATVGARREVEEALRSDPLVSARFR